jgi:hypothetical protein
MKTPKINFEPLPAAAGSVRDTPRTDWREERELNTCREALQAADECLSLIEDVGHGAMSDNVTVARGIVLAALSQNVGGLATQPAPQEQR